MAYLELGSQGAANAVEEAYTTARKTEAKNLLKDTIMNQWENQYQGRNHQAKGLPGEILEWKIDHLLRRMKRKHF